MGLRINTNIPSVSAIRALRGSAGQVDRAMERMSTGLRINRAADDVAGLTISEKIKSQIRSSEQAQRNAQDGISFIQVAEGALSETTNILTRVRELSTQAASDTIGEKERGFLNVEAQQLLTELDRIAKTTQYSGTFLLNGSGGNLDFHIGTQGNKDNYITFDAGLANSTVGALGVSGIGVSNKDDARGAMDKIEDAIGKVGTMRANYGAIQSRMQSVINTVEISAEALKSANSRMRDADIAEESANLARASIIRQAGTATLAQANTVPSLALKLL
jgi:flagellin